MWTLNNQKSLLHETKRENIGPLSSQEQTYYTSTREDKMICKFNPHIGSILIVFPLLQKLLVQKFISHSKRNRISRMFCRETRNLIQQSIEINAYLIFMNLFSTPIWTDVFSMLNDGNRRSCKNVSRSWCQLHRIFLSCQTKRYRKNCRATCNRKCRKLKTFIELSIMLLSTSVQSVHGKTCKGFRTTIFDITLKT